VRVVVRLQALPQDPAVEDVPSDEDDEEGMLDIVVEDIASRSRPVAGRRPGALVMAAFLKGRVGKAGGLELPTCSS
jgi:hypothetical protein